MLFKTKSAHYLPITVLVIGGLTIVSTILQLLTTSAISRLVKKPPAIMTTLETGKPLAVRPLLPGERTPEGIRYFTTTILYELFQWDDRQEFTSVLEVKKPKQDRGVVVANGQKIPTNTWKAGFAVSSNFRKELLEHIADIIPKEVFSGHMQVRLMFDSVSIPELLTDGKWKVIVKAGLHFFEKKTLLNVVPFEKVIYVEAIDIPALPDTEDETDQAIFTMRLSGLQIFHIEDVGTAIPE